MLGNDDQDELRKLLGELFDQFDEPKRSWLVLFAQCGVAREASRRVGVGSSTPHWWKCKLCVGFEEFREAYELCKEIYRPQLEDTVDDLCTNGIRKKKFTAKGEPVIDPETGKQYEEVTWPYPLMIRRLNALSPGFLVGENQEQIPDPQNDSDEESIQVVEVDDWYGTKKKSLPSPSERDAEDYLAESSEVQASAVREAVGQEHNGVDRRS